MKRSSYSCFWKAALLGSQQMLALPVSDYLIAEQREGHGLVEIGVRIASGFRDVSERNNVDPRLVAYSEKALAGQSPGRIYFILALGTVAVVALAGHLGAILSGVEAGAT